MSAVSIRDVSVAFEAVRVFDGLSLDIEEGEFVVLLGPSGCGKSTLLNAVAGLIDVADGQIFIGGRNVTWEEPKDRGIAMVFQSYALYPRMSVRENMSFGLRMAKTPKAEIGRRVAQAAELLQIGHLLDRRPDQLSGGQRQRVAIGRALVRDAAVFLFDEPLSNLDAMLRNELRVEIKRLHARLGKATMIYVTHDQIEAMTLADRIVVMRDQKVQQIGSPAEIYGRPANLFVAGFIGAPQMNFLNGRLEAEGGGLSFVADTLRLPLAGYAFNGAPPVGEEVVLGVRPEHLALAEAGLWQGFGVDIVEPMGADTVLWCSDGTHTLQVRTTGTSRITRGERVGLGLDPEQVSLFAADTGERL
ncbi:ABC transporter ATP-binding protein [Chelatococcus daeguensis]|uniref:ABC transporter ATP-binding protein n=1 Tax=Chelatococcus daeguensis TaxID=444444 RepID=A0AAC9NYL2_9HYPH|nr:MULTISPECIES: ABC transporter ATP-binding protein [Chelatococcus]APF37552.1 ABC transporter ATP-binding protein [Chelatococcus daeguensis]KZE35487.1 ABC transporter ATP-binding protein [Chelatococcus daeguensis]MBM3085485.1 ABC transporter ATP-binding protein [Chelatococcus daeguensis]